MSILDDRAFNILMEEYRPMIMVYLRSIVTDIHLAEDLTQETFLAAYKSLDSLKEDEKFGKWLRVIAKNNALMHWRSNSSKFSLLTDNSILDGLEEVFSSYDRREESGEWWDHRRDSLIQCVKTLSGSLSQAVDLIYRRSFSLREAAEELRASESAIGKRVSRARALLRECIENKLKTPQA